MYKIYGIPNCDTVKKTLVFLKTRSVAFDFVDYKKNPPTIELLKDFKKQIGELPVNKKGPTFRKIKEIYEKSPEAEQIQLLIENSSAIKRPIILKQGKIVSIGYDEKALNQL